MYRLGQPVFGSIVTQSFQRIIRHGRFGPDMLTAHYRKPEFPQSR
jgi:hypothetical protein